MRVSWHKPALVAVCLAGCVHRSPEERILAAFSGAGGEWPFAEQHVYQDCNVAGFCTDVQSRTEKPPEYVRFRDDLSAQVFRNITRSGKIRLAGADQGLFCPGLPVKGSHGYVLGAKVDTVMGDSAVATVTKMCTNSPPAECPRGQLCPSWGNVIEYGTTYLLALTNRNWHVIKVISAAAAIPM
jgi:hypothetical protein